jgi:hypothetical protein
VSNFRIRPLTVALFGLAVVLAVIGVLYFTRTAGNLPHILPGHIEHSAKHHYKHGLVAVTLAVLALFGAWFTTAPDRPTSS